ncbi:type VI secretion system baseplate subunit TssK [Paraburkholderia sp. CNPSo 3272]|uniref:type VI secretion system baseplate subunit TssK n=1 Tax=Paraburkholderia sp. CNPSo 3272 TaxID=2940931 RepID=UPI0020B85A8B|nr:type VI secretion system baseplate subunit TssK [Paraburkholderia sp. CNPSo 3272]MCP3723247.1 type VI secretion system baseplate subunit TssK [Paraburkholderia sp. CNPSo 3272]
MRTFKPLWQEGIVLSPHHFQQQGRWWEFAQQQFVPLAIAEPWGVLEAAPDEELLLNGRVKLTTLKMRFADGTPIDTSIADVLPPARDLARDVGSDVQSVIVFVGLPLLDAVGNNCRADGETVSRPRRYFREYAEVPDLHGTVDAELAVERHALQLLFDFESHADYVVCPIFRLVRGQRGVFDVDHDWVPPCLALSGHPRHEERVSRIADILQAKSIALAARRSERIDDVAEFGVADVSLFWLLHCLNTQWPELRFLASHPYQPPERLYHVLAQLTGALMTFSTRANLAEIPAYEHARQDEVFSKLETLIRELLDAVIPSRVVPIGLLKKATTYWSGQIHDDRLLEGADWYLSVNAAMPAFDLVELLPRLCKIGAPDEVTHIVNAALPGVPLRSVQRVPAAIPVRLENQYFALDAKDPVFTRMLAARTCQIYLPASVPEASLELYAVLTSQGDK